MRELRVQCGGRPLRVFYAFDPTRSAILIIGGDKTGDNRFYDLCEDANIEEIRTEGLVA